MLRVSRAEPVGARHVSSPAHTLLTQRLVRGGEVLGLEARADEGEGGTERGARPAERGNVRLLGLWLAPIGDVDSAQVVEVRRDVGAGDRRALLDVQVLPHVVERRPLGVPARVRSALVVNGTE